MLFLSPLASAASFDSRRSRSFFSRQGRLYFTEGRLFFLFFFCVTFWARTLVRPLLLAQLRLRVRGEKKNGKRKALTRKRQNVRVCECPTVLHLCHLLLISAFVFTRGFRELRARKRHFRKVCIYPSLPVARGNKCSYLSSSPKFKEVLSNHFMVISYLGDASRTLNEQLALTAYCVMFLNE